MARSRSELLQGTLDMLVLRVLEQGPRHGYAISERILQISGGVFEVNQGSLYPALQRLLRKGWLRTEWRTSENNRRARYYTLSSSGARQLTREIAAWKKASGAVERILSPAWEV